MKSRIFILITISFFISTIFSQPGMPFGKNRLNHLKNALDLTDEQVTKIESIIKSNKTKLKALQEKQEAVMEEIEDNIQKIINDENKEIEKLLTKEQLVEFKSLKKHMAPPRQPKCTDDFPGIPESPTPPPPPPVR